MSQSTDVIERVLATALLLPEMVVLARPARQCEIAAEEAELTRPISREHRSLLERWNGANLDVLRIFGCGPANAPGIPSIAEAQFSGKSQVAGAVAFGSDPSGFVFLEAEDGAVWSVDSDGGAIRRLANGMGEFFECVVFGPEAGRFAGDDWLAELRDAGLLP